MIQVSYIMGHDDISSGWQCSPNYAGGVSVLFAIKNISQKTIKYCTLYFVPYNAVGDRVSCSVRGVTETSVNFTGPLEPNKTELNRVFSNAWYNPSITRVSLTRVLIEYMDGSKETINSYIAPVPGVYRSSGGGSGGKSEGGCYVATAVYGSYNCPQVWTLRRYRDYTLAETWYGRAFIRTYYAISPTLVKWFGNTEWFKKMWKTPLDKLVNKLQNEGVENTPYSDRKW